ncbi:hypothetical protein COOONC_25724 [Cooperia oncophora]
MARITRRKANTTDAGEGIPLPTRHRVSQECTMVNEDFDKLSVSELLSSIIETNKDPIIGKMLVALLKNVQIREKRSRSIVIAGVEESKRDLAPSARQNELETTVARIIGRLGRGIFSYGEAGSHETRLVKVVLPTVTHWRRAEPPTLETFLTSIVDGVTVLPPRYVAALMKLTGYGFLTVILLRLIYIAGSAPLFTEFIFNCSFSLSTNILGHVPHSH